MLAVMRTILTGLWFIFKIVGFLCLPFVVSAICWFLYFRLVKKMKLPPSVRVKKTIQDNLLFRIFVLFPRRYVLDLFEKPADQFDLYGLHLFCGEQGSGKTMTMCYMLRGIMKQYPKAIIRTNFDFNDQHGEIGDWKDVLRSNNGIYGQVESFDELQNWFSSMESKNFPPDMLTEITQQRKQRKCIMGTSQVFTRVSKAIREQVTYLYEPMTILGSFTICPVYKPNCDENGTILKKRLIRLFCFPHTDALRNCYDTYKKIERYSNVGFVDRPTVVDRPVLVKEK